MKHFMKLNALPFALMKSGKKDVELRLIDEKRRCVAVGDEIEFTCVETGEVLLTVVKHRHEYADFHTLYENFDKEQNNQSNAKMKHCSGFFSLIQAVISLEYFA